MKTDRTISGPAVFLFCSCSVSFLTSHLLHRQNLSLLLPPHLSSRISFRSQINSQFLSFPRIEPYTVSLSMAEEIDHYNEDIDLYNGEIGHYDEETDNYNEEIDYYKVLRLLSCEEGVKLSPDEIEGAYKLQYWLFHPDNRPYTAADFRQFCFLYEFLQDDACGRDFDARLLFREEEEKRGGKRKRMAADLQETYSEEVKRRRRKRQYHKIKV